MHAMVSTVMLSPPTNLTNLNFGLRLGVAGEKTMLIYSSNFQVLTNLLF